MNKIKIGDEIKYKSCFGGGPIKVANVEGLSITDNPGEKYGRDVREVNIDDVKANKVVFDLSDGHWCYSGQIVT